MTGQQQAKQKKKRRLAILQMPLLLPLPPLRPLLLLPLPNSLPLPPLSRLPLASRPHLPQLHLDPLHLCFLIPPLVPRGGEDGFLGDFERGLEVGEFGGEHGGEEGVGFGVKVRVEGAGKVGESGVATFLFG
jgi:hypothetical protein